MRRLLGWLVGLLLAGVAVFYFLTLPRGLSAAELAALPAGDRGIGGVDGDGGRCGEEGKLPEADAAADVEGEAKLVRRGAAGDGGQGLQVGPEIGDVARMQPGERGVGEGGVELPPVRRDPAQHGVGEVAGAPAADAVAPVAGDVGDDEVAEAGFKHPAAAELETVLAFGLLRNMAGGAAAGPEPRLAAGRVARGQRRQLGGR